MIIAAFFCSRCANPDATAPVTLHQDSLQRQTDAIAGKFSNQTQLHFDSSAIETFLGAYPAFQSFRADLQQFYRQRSFAYAWYDSKGLIEQAHGLNNRMMGLADEGIADTLPYQQQFHRLMENADSSLSIDPINPMAELMLTAQYFSFARQVWQGLDAAASQKASWYIPRKQLDLQTLLDTLLTDSSAAFHATEPVYRQYDLLKNALKTYRQLEAAGNWAPIAAKQRVFRIGDSSTTILEIRKRLFLTGDFSGDTSNARFDSSLAKAVGAFQQRHGWKEDGIIGPQVLAGLNTPIRQLIRKILVNMERCRWVPATPAGDYLVVNIPAYKLYLYQGDSLLWNMDVVTGEPLHKTAVFTGEINQVVFSPYWYVPPGILKNEILPGIRKDPNYLKKYNMEPYGNTVRQKPGPNNSLGRVKFLFPNSFNIYLHDTPAKSLFAEDQRAFSHGCIRLAEPFKLAEYLLKAQPEWTAEKIRAAMNAGKERFVSIKAPIPVFITYFTSWVDRKGNLNLRKDVYQRDERLAEMLLTATN